jgi:hypothetical protein
MAAAALVPLVALLFSASLGQLDPHFYEHSCPQAQQVVASCVGKAHYKDPRMAASLLRLHFHDCFVKVRIARNLVAVTKLAALLMHVFISLLNSSFMHACVQGCDASLLQRQDHEREAVEPEQGLRQGVRGHRRDQVRNRGGVSRHRLLRRHPRPCRARRRGHGTYVYTSGRPMLPSRLSRMHLLCVSNLVVICVFVLALCVHFKLSSAPAASQFLRRNGIGSSALLCVVVVTSTSGADFTSFDNLQNFTLFDREL